MFPVRGVTCVGVHNGEVVYGRWSKLQVAWRFTRHVCRFPRSLRFSPGTMIPYTLHSLYHWHNRNRYVFGTSCFMFHLARVGRLPG